MGGINFGWLDVWVVSPDWLSRKLEVCDICQALRWCRRAWGRGVQAVPRLCIVCPGIYLTSEEKLQKNLRQGNRTALGWSVMNEIRLVELAIAGNELDWPASPCCPWISRQTTGSTLCQRKYLLSCPTRGFPTSETWSGSGIQKFDNFALFNSGSESKKREFGCGYYVRENF